MFLRVDVERLTGSICQASVKSNSEAGNVGSMIEALTSPRFPEPYLKVFTGISLMNAFFFLSNGAKATTADYQHATEMINLTGLGE